MTTAQSLRVFLDAAPSAALIEVAEAKGSTPREEGAWMLVAPTTIFGTIGGGQLEFLAIGKAREMLAGPHPPLCGEGGPKGRVGVAEQGDQSLPPPRSATRIDPPHKGEGGASAILDIPLGPEIGQCCGGRVALSIRPLDAAMRAEMLARAETEDARLPHVYVFGGGHVGHALASALALLPVHATVIETRADALPGMPAGIATRLTAVPEEFVIGAPPHSAFVVLTHDHALDFLIVAEVLKRGDAAYVGMIGSKTKKATFRSWYLKTAGGTEEGFARLVSPIGGDQVKDKRPAVIAALAAAEIMTALAEARPTLNKSYNA